MQQGQCSVAPAHGVKLPSKPNAITSNAQPQAHDNSGQKKLSKALTMDERPRHGALPQRSTPFSPGKLHQRAAHSKFFC